jgi:hypothetical protein
MKNSIERYPSRLEEHKNITEEKRIATKKIDELEAPYGHLKTDNLVANMCHESLNVIASLPNLLRVKMLEKRVKKAQNKLEEIYQNDKENALELNENYTNIIKKAVETGDDTERKEFEKNFLGMEDEPIEEK